MKSPTVVIVSQIYTVLTSEQALHNAEGYQVYEHTIQCDLFGVDKAQYHLILAVSD